MTNNGAMVAMVGNISTVTTLNMMALRPLNSKREKEYAARMPTPIANRATLLASRSEFFASSRNLTGFAVG